MGTIDYYRQQVAIARTEIYNLRQQITSLRHAHQKDLTTINSTLNNLRCAKCSEKATTVVQGNTTEESEPENFDDDGCINLTPIGVLETPFPNKRAVSRQASVLDKARGAFVIDPNEFNNPHHALSGLEDYSHMWIIYYFHVIENKHVPAKVAPPRLLGQKLGIFATRCPNRPCRIGMSLVEIDRIEGNKVYFYGVDMVNGTPVLDIKPYIPQYDSPKSKFPGCTPIQRQLEGHSDVANVLSCMQIGDDSSRSSSPRSMNISRPNICSLTPSDDEIQLDVQQSNVATPNSPSSESPLSADLAEGSSNSPIRILETERGAPDGQERYTPPQSTSISSDGIRVPQWISNPPSQRFEVIFTDDALTRLHELLGDRAASFKSNIESLLSEDPRSHYVRSRYPDHEYSCVFEDVSISCVFDTSLSKCSIIAVRDADEMQAEE